MMAYSTALRFMTGSVPGRPMTCGSTWVFGSAPKPLRAAVNILLAVASWTWISSPTSRETDWTARGGSIVAGMTPKVYGGSRHAPFSLWVPQLLPNGKLCPVPDLASFLQQRLTTTRRRLTTSQERPKTLQRRQTVSQRQTTTRRALLVGS